MKYPWLIGILFFLLLDAFIALYFLGPALWPSRSRGSASASATIDSAHHDPMANTSVTSSEWSHFDSLTLIGLKKERQLEVWGHLADQAPQFITRFPFTGFSGKLGPKLREGDRQIPEGLYRIEYLNPNSSYHLSMKVSYPNSFDRQKGKLDGRDRLGFDIFIHGKSATIGCIPIGDAAIEILFAMVQQIGPAHTAVILSPYDMRVETLELEIPEIEWESQLYQQIHHSLQTFQKTDT